jgi:hypothetical protein
MDLKEAAAIAKQHVGALFAGEAPQNIRLEGFLYDDHLAVWTLTIGFALTNGSAATSPPQPRSYKIGFRRPTNPFCRSSTADGRFGLGNPLWLTDPR